MKDLIVLVLYAVEFACVLGFVFSLLNRIFGWHMGFKGAEVPSDLSATLAFAAVAAICGAIIYFWGSKRSA